MASFIERRVNDLKRGAHFAWNDTRRTVLLAVSAGWFLSLGVRMVYPVLLPHLRTTYGFDLATAGLLLTVLWGAYAVGQLPAGVLTDRFGERYVLAASTGGSAVVLGLVITAQYPLVLFLTTALFGLATALYGVARYTAVSKVFPDRDGAAIGITLAAGNLGNVLLPAAAGTLAAAFAWQIGLGITVPLFVGVAVYLWLVVPRGSTASTNADIVSSETADLLRTQLRRPAIIIVTAILILGFSVFQAFTGFYPTYLIEAKGLSPSIATAIFSFYFTLAIIVQPISGAVYDRLGIRRTLPLFLGFALTGLVLLPFVTGLWALVATTVLLSCMTSNIAITMPYITDVLPEAIQGTGLGILRTVYMLIGAWSPTIIGTLGDLGYFDEAFLILAALIGGVVILATQLPAPTRT